MRVLYETGIFFSGHLCSQPEIFPVLELQNPLIVVSEVNEIRPTKGTYALKLKKRFGQVPLRNIFSWSSKSKNRERHLNSTGFFILLPFEQKDFITKREQYTGYNNIFCFHIIVMRQPRGIWERKDPSEIKYELESQREWQLNVVDEFLAYLSFPLKENQGEREPGALFRSMQQ